jgi:hypothetical protein
MERFLEVTDIPAFKAVGPKAKVIPFYATRYIDKEQQAIFTKLDYNIIIPNGAGLSVIRTNQQIRLIHTVARTLRTILK